MNFMKADSGSPFAYAGPAIVLPRCMGPVVVVLLTLLTILPAGTPSAAEPAAALGSQGASNQGPGGSEEGVIARVNGEPIYERQLIGKAAPGSFDASVTGLREQRLARLIDEIEIRQYLAAHKVQVTDAEVALQVATLRKTPPSLGCPCCRFPSLEAYLQSNGMSLDDLRGEVRGTLGLRKYTDTLWRGSIADPARRKALVTAQRQDYEKEYARGWHIFFNTFQVVGKSNADAATVDAQAHAKANAAWNRLKKGESFAAVAKAVSEDQVSGGKGGDLGITSKNVFGKEFADMLATLKPGVVSRPFKTPYGWHIAKWRPIADADLIEISKRDFVDRKTNAIMDEINRTTKIVRYRHKS